MNKRDVFRIVDANLNRLREALRVCEDVTRFSIEDEDSTASLKKIRHGIMSAISASKDFKYSSLLAARDSAGDVGKRPISREMKRKDTRSIFMANIQRAKESARVLEEFSKIIDEKTALRFKRIRFQIYDTEKKICERL